MTLVMLCQEGVQFRLAAICIPCFTQIRSWSEPAVSLRLLPRLVKLRRIRQGCAPLPFCREVKILFTVHGGPFSD